MLAGGGQLWRRDHQGTEEVVALLPGGCVDIPLGTEFQFRNTGEQDLQMLLLTMPSWPGTSEAVPAAVERWEPHTGMTPTGRALP